MEVVQLQNRWASQPLKARTETRKLLEREGVSEEQLNRFMEKVNKKPESWAKIWERIDKELEKVSPSKGSIPPKNQ